MAFGPSLNQPFFHPAAPTARRFLLLLADEKDFQSDAAVPLVRVGPRTVRTHLLKAAVFALAFVAGTGIIGHLLCGATHSEPGSSCGARRNKRKVA